MRNLGGLVRMDSHYSWVREPASLRATMRTMGASILRQSASATQSSYRSTRKGRK